MKQENDRAAQEQITDLERDVLIVAAGGNVPGFVWGAWVSACMEGLAGSGLIRGESDATLTDKGRALLRNDALIVAGCVAAEKEAGQ